MDFSSIEDIQKNGFKGFVSVQALQQKKCDQVPKEIGVYLFIRQTDEPPTFLAESGGGWFKDRNPTVPVSELARNWVSNTAVVYIGKAGTLTGKATLKSRLWEYMRFGLGKKAGHWGGRYIWQLEDHQSLVVCWRRTFEQEPSTVETKLLQEFIDQYGKLPFANRKK